MLKKYMQISLAGGGTYVQQIDEVPGVVEGELDGLGVGDTATLSFTVIEMEETEYEKLPEFSGH